MALIEQMICFPTMLWKRQYQRLALVVVVVVAAAAVVVVDEMACNLPHGVILLLLFLPHATNWIVVEELPVAADVVMPLFVPASPAAALAAAVNTAHSAASPAHSAALAAAAAAAEDNSSQC